MRYKVTIAYEGTGFCGWQRQPGHLSVQEFVEDCLHTILRCPIKVEASGRTDKGVHAHGQVIHFDYPEKINTHKLIQSINYFGHKMGVSFLEISEVDADFHARFSACERTYHYHILNRDAFCPFSYNRVWHIRDRLNIEDMQEGANYLVGKHDFTSFRDTHCQAASPVRTLSYFHFEKIDHTLKATLKATSFLHHQVRIIMGTLVEIGRGRLQPQHIKTILAAKDRTKAGLTAPPTGLFLAHVRYPK